MMLGCLPNRVLIFRPAAVLLSLVLNAAASTVPDSVMLRSPDGKNEIRLEANAQEDAVKYSVNRRGVPVIEPSGVRPILSDRGLLVAGARVIDIQRGPLDKTFKIP